MRTPPKQTTVITDHSAGTITINGNKRRAYPSPLGCRCRLSHAEVRALGLTVSPRENYELIDGRSLRTMGESDHHRMVDALPWLRDGETLPPETTHLEPLPEPPRPPRKPRGRSRKYAALVDAARTLAPILPPEHPLRRALDRLDADE